MSLSKFLNDIKASPLMLDNSGHETLRVIANSILKGHLTQENKTLAIQSNYGQSYIADSSSNPFDSWQSGSIAIIPIQGIMLKSGSWFYYGMDEIAIILKLAYSSEKIKAVLLKGNSPGGATDSVYLLEDVLRTKNKPTIMFVDGSLLSCAMYIGSFCDKIYAINSMCSIGGLGVFARLIAPNEENQNSEYKIIEVYPDESHLKNYPEREAVMGNKEPLKEVLQELAIHFQNILKENRPGITSEEVYAGKSFYAKEALEIGLIDGIKSEDSVFAELQSIGISQTVQTEISQMFN